MKETTPISSEPNEHPIFEDDSATRTQNADPEMHNDKTPRAQWLENFSEG